MYTLPSGTMGARKKILPNPPLPYRETVNHTFYFDMDTSSSSSSSRDWGRGKQGANGVSQDALLAYAAPWEFKLEDIEFQNIYFYNGELDLSIPISMGKMMSNAIANSKLKIYPNDGHLSILANQMSEIEKDLFTGS